MTVETQITVVGVQQALKELNKISPTLRRQVTKDFKEIIKPVIGEVQASIPSGAPLSGMERVWRSRSGWQIFPYSAGELRKSVQGKINTRKPRPTALGNEVTAAFRVLMKSPAAMAVDMAGRRGGGKTARGGAMVAGLERRFGGASRFMWPAWDRKQHVVMDRMRKLVEEVMAQVGRRLVER